jgi:hypothetical protein
MQSVLAVTADVTAEKVRGAAEFTVAARGKVASAVREETAVEVRGVVSGAEEVTVTVGGGVPVEV